MKPSSNIHYSIQLDSITALIVLRHACPQSWLGCESNLSNMITKMMSVDVWCVFCYVIISQHKLKRKGREHKQSCQKGAKEVSWTLHELKREKQWPMWTRAIWWMRVFTWRISWGNPFSLNSKGKGVLKVRIYLFFVLLFSVWLHIKWDEIRWDIF